MRRKARRTRRLRAPWAMSSSASLALGSGTSGTMLRGAFLTTLRGVAAGEALAVRCCTHVHCERGTPIRVDWAVAAQEQQRVDTSQLIHVSKRFVTQVTVPIAVRYERSRRVAALQVIRTYARVADHPVRMALGLATRGARLSSHIRRVSVTAVPQLLNS